MGLERRKKEDLSEKASKNIGWEEAMELILKENQKEVKTDNLVHNSEPLKELKNNETPNNEERENNTGLTK
jgi:hypothetical protein